MKTADIVSNILKIVRPIAVVEAVQEGSGSFSVATQQGGRVFFNFIEAGYGETFGLALDEERSYKLYVPRKCEYGMVVGVVNFLSCMSFGSHDSSDFGNGDFNYISEVGDGLAWGKTIKSINSCIVLALLVEHLRNVTNRVDDCLSLIDAEGARCVTWGAVVSWTGRRAAYAIWR